MKITGKQYELPSDGQQNAVCVDIIDKGDVQTDFGVKHKMRIVWELEETGKNGKRLTCSKQYTVSIHKKATLTKDVKSWLGAAPKTGFDTDVLLGKPCRVVIEHNEHDGVTYANVTSVLKPGKDVITPSGDYKRSGLDDGEDAGSTADGGDDDSIPF